MVVVGFRWWFFVISVFLTFLPFLWLLKRPKREKIYMIPFVVFFFIYSGVGSAWDNCSNDYLMHYFIWMTSFSLTVYFTIGKKRSSCIEGIDSTKSLWVIQHSSFFIVLYIALQLLTLVLNGKLYNLISPPSPDLSGVMDTVSENSSGGGLVYYINHIIFVFYFVSLYKYRTQPIKLFVALFVPFYLTYVDSGYLARSTVMAFLIIYIIAIYYYNAGLRRRLRLIVFVGLPFVLIGLSYYTFIRLGHDIDISAGEAINYLIYQETSYPTQYDLIIKQPFDADLLKDYWNWLLTLPLPGFLKDSTKDYFFNGIFTERLYGTMRGTMGFSVALPGIVGEGLFIFGRYLYFFHAMILGLFVGFTYRIIKSKHEFFLFLYTCYFCAFHFARAGTVSSYSFYLKDFLVYEIIMLLVAAYRPIKNKKLDQEL